jgi:threonyl-tRNA synthetase
VDFAQGRRFKLSYNSAENKPEVPLIIHRAPLGTHERFIGFLIEHYAGKFPLWLSPLQVKILPISDKFMDYCLEVQKQLRKKGIRVEIDDRSEKIGKKIRDTEVAHIPYMFVIGEKEMLANSAALRIQGKGDQGVFSISDLVERIKSEIEERA